MELTSATNSVLRSEDQSVRGRYECAFEDFTRDIIDNSVLRDNKTATLRELTIQFQQYASGKGVDSSSYR
jgi:hypothetical protein